MLPVLHQGGQNRLSFLSPQKGHSRKYNGWIATKTQTHYRNNHWIIINKHCRNKNEIKIDLLQYAGHLVLHAVLQEIGINHILYLCKIRSNLKLKNILFETDITKKILQFWRVLFREELNFGMYELWLGHRAKQSIGKQVETDFQILSEHTQFFLKYSNLDICAALWLQGKCCGVTSRGQTWSKTTNVLDSFTKKKHFTSKH